MYKTDLNMLDLCIILLIYNNYVENWSKYNRLCIFYIFIIGSMPKLVMFYKSINT